MFILDMLRLKVEQTGNDLQIVLNPVVNLSKPESTNGHRWTA